MGTNISFILELQKETPFNYSNGENATLVYNNGSYKLCDNSITHRNKEKNINIKSEKFNFIIPRTLSYSHGRNFSNNKFSSANQYEVCELKNKNISHEQQFYFQLIIPIYDKTLDFFTTIEHDNITATTIKIENTNFKFYEKRHMDDKYLIIDTFEKITYKKFSDYCFAILSSYGFITGDFFQGEKYFFKNDDLNSKNFEFVKFNSFRKTTNSILRPICSNPYAYSLDNIPIESLSKLTKQQFSDLCFKTFSNEKFRMLLLQIIEATKATLITSAFMLAVCIEELVELFLDESDKKKILTECESCTSKKIIEAIKNINCKYNDEDGKTLKEQIISRVHDIAKNKSNIQKIRSIFNDFNLNKREFEALSNRNKLLHGVKPDIKGITLDSIESQDLAYWYLQLRLYTLVSMVILNKIGYKGEVLNHYSLNEKAIGFFELNEQPYRKL